MKLSSHKNPDLLMRTRKLRVPQGDGEILCQPDLEEAPAAASLNRVRLATAGSLKLQGRTLEQMRQDARAEILARAFRYTSEINPRIRPNEDGGPLIVTGHQPQLFHPGVWVKNFAAAGVARRAGGTAINLVVDNDSCESAAISVPVKSDRGLMFNRVNVESRQPEQPWEERRIQHPNELAGFRRRVSAELREWKLQRPLVEELEFEPAPLGSRLSDVLTAARSRAEASRGLQNLELPISQMCQTESFARFLCHILVNINRFHDVHNSAITEYRRRNNLRSRTHPVPELEERDGWWESPFWSWRKGDSQRSRLFARQLDANTLAISDGKRTIAELPVGPGKDACCAAEVLMQLGASGERLRTRALTTTIFARLMFADLFIHGIGGAKYDEMTDVILSDFYGVEPPEFMTVSATLQLLGDHASEATSEDLSSLQRHLRRLKFDAQHYVSEDDSVLASLVSEKRELIRQQNIDPTSGPQSRLRYRRFRELNRRLSRETAAERHRVEKEIADLQFQLRQDELLRSRDLSMCLYPADRLWALFDQVLA